MPHSKTKGREIKSVLFEKYILCEEGFGNLYDERGECTGFQLQLRLPYYRGVRFALIDDIQISVDGITYPRESITVTLDGETYTLDEMLTMADYYWRFGQIGTVTVHCRKDFERMIGPDSNRVQVRVGLRVSYCNFSVATAKMVRRTVNHG